MALYMKQDFSPPLLSRKWIAYKFRPNVLLYSREHIVSILESGLLFREDSAEVEQEAPAPEEVWRAAGGGSAGWLTAGERVGILAVVAACAAAFPPRSLSRGTLASLSGYLAAGALARLALRRRAGCAGAALRRLLGGMRAYLALARRAAACVRDHRAHEQIGSVSSVLESTHRLLCTQQTRLASQLSRASSALLGNAPWLHDCASPLPPAEGLQRIHHLFLVVQSTFLKHVAMLHFIPPKQARIIYKNHNERIYWVHTVLLENLHEEFKENYEALDRMYRLLKNYGNKDFNVKKPGFAINDKWLYSEVHSGVARTCLELKMALEKCTNLDMFLDSCAFNDHELDLSILNDDIDHLIDDLTKCLVTAQNSQIRLKKLQRKFGDDEQRVIEPEVEEEVLKIDDEPPEVKDEVFYFVKTDDDVVNDVADVTTAPGKREKEASKIVLNELRRKLVKREDFMRERERQALVKTMGLKEEFPRQIKMEEFSERGGFIKKILKTKQQSKILNVKCKPKKIKNNYKLVRSRFEKESDINDFFEANVNLKADNKFITIKKDKNNIIVIKWDKVVKDETKENSNTSDLSEPEAVNGAINESINNAVNQSINLDIKFNKKDLELSPSSESDFEFEKECLLKDVRKHRVVRKKNHPVKRGIDNVDESLKPIEYSFGTGMAIASVLQVNMRAPNMGAEEVFIGDGEVSEDSGNDEDA